jgi:two-component system chemotaxis response regulator CheB
MAPVRTLICHGSRPRARRLREQLEYGSTVEVVGIAPSGEHALESLRRLRPAVVVMDLDLPGMDAVRAIAAIMRERPVPILALAGDRDGGRRATAALGAGAADTLSDAQPASALRRKVSELAAARPRPAAAVRLREVRSLSGVRAIGIGASTGGPRALRKLLAPLPAGFGVPIFVVQHIGAGFVDPLADWLDGQLSLPVGVARDGEVAGPGVWLAPDGLHLTVDGGLRMSLLPERAAGGHCPSADVLLEALAAAFGPAAAAVILTGMGSDGAAGAAAVIAAGGLALAQDEASAIVFGMPRVAAERGARTLGLGGIADTLGALGT